MRIWNQVKKKVRAGRWPMISIATHKKAAKKVFGKSTKYI